jgi:Ca-activated chloride channel family protein
MKTLLLTTAVLALGFMDLWLTPDQQGRYFFERDEFAQAAEHFEDPLWKGIAHYMAEDFEAAIDQFSRRETAESFFNMGNAFARLGSYEEAVAAFDKALALRPEYQDAEFNRDLIQALIERQKEEEEYAGGTGGMLEPDEIVVDEKGKKGESAEMTQMEEAVMSDEQLTELWMRRLQTTPATFLRMKFAFQAAKREAEGK